LNFPDQSELKVYSSYSQLLTEQMDSAGMDETFHKLKILTVAASGGAYGGVEVFTAAAARQALDSGPCEVRIVYRVPRKTVINPNLESGLRRFNVNWRIICFVDVRYVMDLLWADVIHCHFPVPYATFPARLLGKKLIVTVEAKHHETRHKFYHRAGLRLAHAQWFISEFVAKTWSACRSDSTSRIVPAICEIPSAHVAPSERKGFFFIARWVPLKGLEQIVEAYATAGFAKDRHPLLLYGDGMLHDEVHALIDKFGIREFVSTPGFVDATEKERAMASARWNLAPTAFAEDLGLTPIEARYCKVPSIVSDIGGLPEAAGADALYCKAGDVASLRQAMEQAAAMGEEEYARRSHACYKSLADYMPSKDFYLGEYKRLLGR
jgi:glycosyltransferase involved in cell wall biosynthesis